MSTVHIHNEILLSILIPTKDRQNQLSVLLNSLKLLRDIAKIQVVISDNSLNQNDTVYDYNIPNIVYNYCEHPMPVADNIEIGLQECQGEYTLVIGDDDFVHPEIISYVKHAIHNNVSVLSYTPGYYWWPGVNNAGLNIFEKTIRLAASYDCKFKKMSSKDALYMFEKSGSVFISQLPRGYHGIVRTELYKKFRVDHGRVVIGSSPDISIALTLCHSIEDYSYIDFPLTLYGASVGSGGGMTAARSHHGELDKLSFLKDVTKSSWPAELPYYWSERMIYYATYREVNTVLKKNNNVNNSVLYARLFCSEPELARRYVRHIFSGNVKLNFPKLLLLYLLYFAKKKVASLVARRQQLAISKIEPENVAQVLRDRTQSY